MMLPSQLTPEQFGRYPETARRMAVEQIAQLRRLPLGFLPALLAVPAAHLWLLVLVAGVHARRRIRGLLVALGALPALIVALYYLIALRIDPLSGAWYLLLLVTGHTVGPVTALVPTAIAAPTPATTFQAS